MKIKRKISFAFLGESYKDCYGIFASIAVSEYPELSKTVDSEQNSIKKTLLMQDVVKSKFIAGKFLDDNDQLVDLKKDEIDFDSELLLVVYNTLMGGGGENGDPKVPEPSETT